MKLKLEPGKYVLAVSGGVDSMVLLDLLSKLTGVELIVAHFDHGIRPDSADDERFVKQAAERYRLRFESARVNLGPAAGEAAARAARYGFLEKVRQEHGAQAIITAHHQDDLIETALINLLRGTGRRGLFAMAANRQVRRPLLSYPKAGLLEYAGQNGIMWREDITNQNQDYLRNYVRRNLMPKLSAKQRRQIIDNLNTAAKADAVIQAELGAIEKQVFNDGSLDRSRFAGLPAEIGAELLVRRFRQMGIADIDKRTVSRISASIRTSKPNQSHPVKNGVKVELTTATARFMR